MDNLQREGTKLALFDLLLPLTLVCLIFLTIPFYQIFEFDNDEGLNLMKAFLTWEGFDLYTEIWSDQPPVLTIILSFLFKVFGASVFASRLLILSFSILLIWSFYQILQRRVGRVPAAIASLLLMVSGHYLRLSVSVMVGLPAIAIALFAIYALSLYQSKSQWWLLIFSGSVFALSLQIKLFTLFLIPLLIFIFLDLKNTKDEGKLLTSEQLHPIAIWLICFGVTYFLIGVLCHSLNYDQLVQAHIKDQIKEEFDNTNGWRFLLSMIRGDKDIFLLSGIGIFAILKRHSWQDFLPIAWLLTALFLLLNHRPIWYHHYLLISIPAAWLAAYGIDVALKSLMSIRWRSRLLSASPKRMLAATVSLLFLTYSIVSLPKKIFIPLIVPPAQWEIVNIVKSHTDQTTWLFSDRSIIPFYANLPVPPEVAVLSRKRIISGNFTFDNLLEVLEIYQPEQIVLARQAQRFKDHPGIQQFLTENYTQTYSRTYSESGEYAVAEHYLINTLVN